MASAAAGGVQWMRGRDAARRADAALAAMAEDICIVAPTVPFDAAAGVPVEAPRAIPVDARCPVCGMFPARFPQWAAQLIYSNGDAHFFDSPASLFTHVGTHALYTKGRRSSRVLVAYVKDMATGVWADAFQATYVAGSSALGPMRNGNYPGFGSPAAAQEFAVERGGVCLQAEALAERLQATLPASPVHRHAVA